MEAGDTLILQKKCYRYKDKLRNSLTVIQSKCYFPRDRQIIISSLCFTFTGNKICILLVRIDKRLLPPERSIKMCCCLEKM